MGTQLFALFLAGLATAAAAAAAARGGDSYIVNGGDAPAGQYPWQGSLEYLGSHTCGSVLVSNLWVLTAAHCVDGREVPSRFQVWLGVHDRSTNQGTKYRVSTITKHPDYISSGILGYPNDISVMRLTTVADTSNPAISTVPMDNSPVNQQYSNCMISGWGRLCGTCSTLPSVLQHASIDTLTNQLCGNSWPMINDYHICVYDMVNSFNKHGACSGDSGGPLQCMDSGSYKLVGLASWVASGCDTTLPAAYARVSYFCSWINQETGLTCG